MNSLSSRSSHSNRTLRLPVTCSLPLRLRSLTPHRIPLLTCRLFRLKKGFKLDVFDTSSVPPQWMEAVVTAVNRSHIEVHYIGWSERYDAVVESNEYKQRIASLGSYSEEVVHYSCCLLCDDGGDTRPLVCCDGCPRVIHLQCLKLRSPPRGDYFCPDCVKHKRGKRIMKDKRDVSQYEEEDSEEERVEEEREKENFRENRSNRAGSRNAAPAAVKRGASASKAVRPASPAVSVTSSAAATDAKRPDARPSDRRALATKAGKPRLGNNAGLMPTTQRQERKEDEGIDEEDEVKEDTERKEQPLTRKRARDQNSGCAQAVLSSSCTNAVSSPTSSISPPSAAPPPVPQPTPPPPIHLAAGVSSAPNQSSRKRVRVNYAAHKQQPQQADSNQADSSNLAVEKEKKETSVDNSRSTAPLASFVDCYRYQATRRSKLSSSISSISSPSASSFTADGLPTVGIPAFSFPPSNFEEATADAYIAHFCSLLDMAADKVSLCVPSELPGVERWERIREKMEEVGEWMRMKCNQQINGEQDVVKDGHNLINRQTKQWNEQLQRFELRLKATTEQRQAAVDEIAAIDQQIEQLKQRREQRRQEMAKRDEDLSQLNANKAADKREHDRKVAELEANVKKSTHRVRMLRDLSEHVSARRLEGDEKEQTGQFWEPLDTIRRRCASMASGTRLREADRTNSNGSVQQHESIAVEETRPADDSKEESKSSPLHVAAASDSCVDLAMTAFVTQSVRNPLAHGSSPYQHNSYDVFDDEGAAEMHSADVPTPLDMRSPVFSSSVRLRLSSASFGSLSSLSSLSTARTISEVPQVIQSSSDDSVSSTQTTMPISPLRGEGAPEHWEKERPQRMEVVSEELKMDSAAGMVEADESLPASNAMSDLSGVRRASGENMEELTAVAEEQLIPEKRVGLSAAGAPSELDDSGHARIASGDVSGASGDTNVGSVGNSG